MRNSRVQVFAPDRQRVRATIGVCISVIGVLLLANGCFAVPRIRDAGTRVFELQHVAEALSAGDIASAQAQIAAAIDGEALVAAGLIIKNPAADDAPWAASVLRRVLESRRRGETPRGPGATDATEAKIAQAIEAVRVPASAKN